MRWTNVVRTAERHVDRVLRYVAYVVGAMAAVGLLSRFVAWLDRGPVAFVSQHLPQFWLGALSAFGLVLWIWVRRLNRRFTMGFADDFKTDLHKNWSFVGPWRITEGHELLVTGSVEGGLTNVGASWENYTFGFQAKILNKCLGVVVRALDLNNYYMLQIRPDRVRPHRRVAVPMVTPRQATYADDSPEASQEPIPVRYTIGWQVMDEIATDVAPRLEDWFSVRLVVRGETAHLYINGQLAFQSASLLKIPMGRVGFRNTGDEAALVKAVRVTLHA